MKHSLTSSWPWLGILVVLAAALRLYGIDDTPLWFDEAYSHWFASQTLDDLWTTIPTHEPHPPLYYTLLKSWTIFGDTEAIMRSLSVLFSVATVPAIYVLGRIIDGRTVGLMAAFFFAISPLHIEFAQQARPYAILSFFVALNLIGATWLLCNPQHAKQPFWLFLQGRWGKHHWAWLGLIIGAGSALWFHNMSALLLVALFAASIFSQIYNHGQNFRFMGNVAIAVVLIMLIWSPLLPWLWMQTQNFAGGFWLPELSFSYVFGTLARLFGVVSPSSPMLMVTALVLLLTFAITPIIKAHNKPNTSAFILLGLVMLGPILLQVLLSFTFHPMLLFRSLIWVSIPFYVALAVGVLTLDKVWAQGGIMALICLAFIITDPQNYSGHRPEPWDKITQSIATNTSKNDAVLFVPNSAVIPFNYYLNQPSAAELLPIPKPFPAIGEAAPYPSGQMGEPGLTPASIRDALTNTRRFSSVWVVTRTNLFDPQNNLVKEMAKTRTLLGIDKHGDITVHHFR